MNPESESRRMAPKEPIVSAAAGRIAEAVPSPCDAGGGISIDFRSAEFNHTDDLNDYSGNYRSFQPLDGIVTADMRHQMERRRDRDMIESCADDAAPVKIVETINDTADAIEASPPLTVISKGRTLIVDRDAERAIACGKLLSDQGLTCTLLVMAKGSPDVSSSRFGSLALLEVNAASITGAFGGFSATVTVKGEQRDLTGWLDNEAIIFDLVLDLQSVPSYRGDILPMGYYAPGPDPANLGEAMRELPEMRGRFHKPQFTAFRESRCIHGRSRTRDCSRCMAVCPFGAIRSVDRKISINHYLCQGCGGCALVCPTDAIRMLHPSREELLSLLRSRLEDRSAGAGFPPTLIISGRETLDRADLAGAGEKTDDGIVHLEVEQIGHVGLEMLLAALTYGAGRVVVACGPQDPPNIRQALEWQTRMAGAILRGLGMPEENCRFAVGPPENSDSPKAVFKPTELDAASPQSSAADTGIPCQSGQADTRPQGNPASRRSIRRATSMAPAAGRLSLRRRDGRPRCLHPVHGMRSRLSLRRLACGRRCAAARIS